MATIPGFIGPSYELSATNVAAQVLRNWQPQTVEVGSEASHLIYMPTPGIETAYALPTSPVRALFAQDGRMFGVGGQAFYEVTDSGAVTSRGTLSATNSSPATITSNGTAGHQLYITSGGKGDIFDLNSNTLSPITAAAYPTNTAMGTYLDTYFLTTKGSSAQFNISNNLDGTLWSTLDFAVRTEQSDNLVGIIQNNKIIWLIGSQTSEPWYDSGAASFPFQAVPQVIVPLGSSSPFSICKLNTKDGNSIAAWLHQTARGAGTFVAAASYSPQRVSQFAQEGTWATYPSITDAVAYCYSDHGHDYAVLTFPSGNATWVYDFTEGQWHQRCWWNPVTANQDRHRGWVHCYAFDQHFVGDWETGVIYSQNVALNTDDGSAIIRDRQSPHTNAEQKMLFFGNFQLDFQTGLGNANDPDSAPTVSLEYSNDGGQTFGSAIPMNAGVLGDYTARCRAAGSLGSARNRVWRIRASGTNPYQGLQQAYVDVQSGTS